MYDPLVRTKYLEKIAFHGNKRKYYRFRHARWYGGIVTGDVLCCNLFCYFCWAGDNIRRHSEHIGDYYTPEHAFTNLMKISRKCGYTQIRLSGQEPTIGKEHLLALLKLIDSTECTFILETNGILIGAEKDYAEQLAEFKNLHVRVSLKGTSKEEFSKLTGAIPEGFELQIKALENLNDANVSYHPSVMTFSPHKIKELKLKNLEIEELILYPHVLSRLQKVELM